MGIIDSVWFRFTCPECGAEESTLVHDKGSGWRGSSWGVVSDTPGFTVSATGGGTTEPQVTSAVCKKCGGSAAVETGYGRPPK
jgi:hypothetical protein